MQKASGTLPVPKDGALVHGIFLEGARWSDEEGTLIDAKPMELYASVPTIHFKVQRSYRNKSIC